MNSSINWLYQIGGWSLFGLIVSGSIVGASICGALVITSIIGVVILTKHKDNK